MIVMEFLAANEGFFHVVPQKFLLLTCRVSFSLGSYVFSVKEDMKRGQRIDTIVLEDRDEIQNKDPIFTIAPSSDTFKMERSQIKDGNLMLKQVFHSS